MKRHRHAPTVRVFASAAGALALALGAACRDERVPAAPASVDAAPGGAESRPALPPGAPVPPVVAPSLAGFEPAWPPGWELVERGSAGRDGRPLAWFTLRAGDPPARAAERALDALRPLAGEGARSTLAGARAQERTIGQITGPRLSAVALAERASNATATEVRVTVDLRAR